MEKGSEDDERTLSMRVANESYLRSFQYKVLNSIQFTNDRTCKKGYILDPTVLSVIS